MIWFLGCLKPFVPYISPDVSFNGHTASTGKLTARALSLTRPSATSGSPLLLQRKSLGNSANATNNTTNANTNTNANKLVPPPPPPPAQEGRSASPVRSILKTALANNANNHHGNGNGNGNASGYATPTRDSPLFFGHQNNTANGYER